MLASLREDARSPHQRATYYTLRKAALVTPQGRNMGLSRLDEESCLTISMDRLGARFVGPIGRWQQYLWCGSCLVGARCYVQHISRAPSGRCGDNVEAGW
jgi:hypothetical protein